MTLEFGKTSKVTVPDGTFPIPEARLEVKHPSAKTQESKGLVPLTLKIGKIMWIHPDLAQDEQWDSKKSSQKANLAMLSLSCRMMTISHQLLLAILKGKSTLAQRKPIYLSRRALDPKNHT